MSRQSLWHVPWHLNSLPGPPILPPHSGHMQFKMPETTSSMVLTSFRRTNVMLTSPAANDAATWHQGREHVSFQMRSLAGRKHLVVTRDTKAVFLRPLEAVWKPARASPGSPFLSFQKQAVDMWTTVS